MYWKDQTEILLNRDLDLAKATNVFQDIFDFFLFL
jgi:hypothetical protein